MMLIRQPLKMKNGCELTKNRRYTIFEPLFQLNEMFANLIKRYGTHRSSTRYLQGLSGKLRVFVYTVHGVIGEYHASNNKKCNAFGF